MSPRTKHTPGQGQGGGKEGKKVREERSRARFHHTKSKITLCMVTLYFCLMKNMPRNDREKKQDRAFVGTIEI